MEDKDYQKTKDKLFALAGNAGLTGTRRPGEAGLGGVKNMKRENNTDNSGQPPLNVNLDYNPETDYKNIGVDYTKGNFNIGGNFQPGYSTTQPGFMTGSTIEVENPSSYNVRAGYKNKNFGFNVNVGSGNNYGASMNFNRQF